MTMRTRNWSVTLREFADQLSSFIAVSQEALAIILHPIFLKERAHHQEANLVFRDHEIEDRVSCGEFNVES